MSHNNISICGCLLTTSLFFKGEIYLIYLMETRSQLDSGTNISIPCSVCCCCCVCLIRIALRFSSIIFFLAASRCFLCASAFALTAFFTTSFFGFDVLSVTSGFDFSWKNNRNICLANNFQQSTATIEPVMIR